MKKQEPIFEYSYNTISNKDFVQNWIREASEEAESKDSRLEKYDNPYDDGLVDISIDPEIKNINYSNFTSNIKPMLLTGAIENLLNKCCDKKYCENPDERKQESYNTIKSNLVTSFVKECGDIDVLLRRMRHESMMLSEYSLLIEEYKDRIMEDVDKDEESSYYVDPEIRQDFFKDLDSVDNEEVILAVRNRVSDAIAQFINKNTEYKLDIQDILYTTQDKINKVDKDPDMEEEEKEEIKESYRETQKRKINNIKNTKAKTIFEKMVYSMAETALKNPAMHSEYMKNNRLDMDQVMESCELMYTLLELCNTSKIVHVDEQYVKGIVENL